MNNWKFNTVCDCIYVYVYVCIVASLFNTVNTIDSFKETSVAKIEWKVCMKANYSVITRLKLAWRTVAHHSEEIHISAISRSVLGLSVKWTTELRVEEQSGMTRIRTPWWISDVSLFETKWVLSCVSRTFYKLSCIFILSSLYIKLILGLLLSALWVSIDGFLPVWQYFFKKCGVK